MVSSDDRGTAALLQLTMRPDQAVDYFRCAGVWLACRIELLTAQDDDERMWRFLGEMDYQTEMAMILEEVRDGQARNRTADRTEPEIHRRAVAVP
jgi:hypothetical protein